MSVFIMRNAVRTILTISALRFRTPMLNSDGGFETTISRLWQDIKAKCFTDTRPGSLGVSQRLSEQAGRIYTRILTEIKAV